ncbi:MAG: cytochrome c biogenesis protein DipZ [Actinobacteria bacterium]|nr:cytochrome c biogenesis protein DipZ [Actinomycetota bacterium]
MLLLLGIGFVAGIVTALSPCVLPVLPVVLAGGATGRRPLAIVAGIVVSFTVFTLFAAWLLDLAGLPEDFLRDLAIALLLLMGLSFLSHRVADVLARPFQALSRRPSGDLGGGVLLGVSLGLVFVPCAGPVLAAMTVVAAQRNVGVDGVILTAAYALGAALPMLGVAFAGQRAATHLRAHATNLRRSAGALVLVAAMAIAFGLDQDLQTRIPGYTRAVQDRIERSESAQRELEELTGAREPSPAAAREDAALEDYGPAPEFRSISQWLNSEPLTLEGLRGQVVLIDFWTYSCINCLRTLPHIKEWDARYRDRGLTIVGVHSPEFAFERVESNVRENTRDLGLEYPIALDNEFGTWRAWHNQYWPAKYLIDRKGNVRYFHFGEGEYAETENAIRELLGNNLPPASRPREPDLDGLLITPETYLGYRRLARYGGEKVIPNAERAYGLPMRLYASEFAFGGRWRVEDERAVAGRGARLRLSYRARDVFLVLSGSGGVDVLVDGRKERRVRVRGDRLYTLVDRAKGGDHLLELRVSEGVAAYAFTFG